MKKPMRRAMLAAAVLGLMASTADRVRAEMIVNFSYSGNGQPDNPGLDCNGTGTFSFPDGFSAVGLGNLTSFNFTMTETTEPPSNSNTVMFGLSDLTSFSATLGPGPTLTSLTLATGPVEGSEEGSYPREFAISSLGSGGASTCFVILGMSTFLTAGDITINSIGPAAVPEPATFALAVL